MCAQQPWFNRGVEVLRKVYVMVLVVSIADNAVSRISISIALIYEQ